MNEKNTALAQEKDWNHYWSLEKTQRFTKISWSKKRIIRILQPYLQKNKNVLDAGCGSGFFSKYFCDQNLNVTALDYSDEALKIAERLTQNRVKTVKADMLKDKLKTKLKNRFDIIFTDGLLEHFSYEQQSRILNNFRSVLNRRGVVVTFVPNKWSPWELIRPFFMPGIKEDPFTLKQLITLNENNQLKVIAHGGVNTVPFAFSPDSIFGSMFGMLLFTISINNESA